VEREQEVQEQRIAVRADNIRRPGDRVGHVLVRVIEEHHRRVAEHDDDALHGSDSQHYREGTVAADQPAQPGSGRRDRAGGVGVAGHRSGDAVVYSHRSEPLPRGAS
jgi:hypothetical protein